MYSGAGQKRSDDNQSAEAMSIITRDGAERIVTFAFELARQEGRKKVTIIHKANILKSTSGLFLEVAREVAARYPDIQNEEMIVDAACMNLVMYPERFDVMVTTNLFGDILSDLCAGLVGLRHGSRSQHRRGRRHLRSGTRLGAGHRRQEHRQPDLGDPRLHPDAGIPRHAGQGRTHPRGSTGDHRIW